MDVMELLASRRTYRRFTQQPVPDDVIADMVEAVRLSSCGANRQAIRLVVVRSPEMVAAVQPLVKWAAYLPPEQGAPKENERPTLFAAVVQDTSIPGDGGSTAAGGQDGPSGGAAAEAPSQTQGGGIAGHASGQALTSLPTAPAATNAPASAVTGAEKVTLTIFALPPKRYAGT